MSSPYSPMKQDVYIQLKLTHYIGKSAIKFVHIGRWCLWTKNSMKQAKYDMVDPCDTMINFFETMKNKP